MDPRLAPNFTPVIRRQHQTPSLSPSTTSTTTPRSAANTSAVDLFNFSTSSFARDLSMTDVGSTNGSEIVAKLEQHVRSGSESAMSSRLNSSSGNSTVSSADSRSETQATTTNGKRKAEMDFDILAPPYSLSANRTPTQTADLEEVPHGISRQARDLASYAFPVHRLAEVLQDKTMQPLVIVACGSFSPITFLHLRMFEMAIDTIRELNKYEVVGGYYSPVSDNYRKAGLAPADHRVRMCELACERTSSWLMVDAWESLQPSYQRTAVVLDHFNYEINVKRGGIKTKAGERRPAKIMLLAGGDLIESMGDPNVWADEDLHHILGRYGCLIVERTGADVRSFLLSHDIMYEHRHNVIVIKQLIYNDISSTKVRLFIRRGMSVQYLLPNSVIRYIEEHGLYVGMSEPVSNVLKF
ncbi:hypothetical protein V1523DRAFT_420635 [Lipomyces doorenjongii]